jgi:thermostable hemolysin
MIPIGDYFTEFRLHFVTRRDERFRAIERLAKGRYRQVYGAELDVLAQDFVWLEPNDRPGEGACAAITPAASKPLFSEQYLDRPCDQLIAQRELKVVLRDHIAELGTFAASDPGSGVELFQILPLVAWLRGFRYALMTAVPDIRGLLSSSGVPFVTLGSARVDALAPDQRARWGSYYANGPITGYVSLEQPAADALISILRRRFDPALLRRRFDQLAMGARSVAAMPKAVSL